MPRIYTVEGHTPADCAKMRLDCCFVQVSSKTSGASSCCPTSACAQVGSLRLRASLPCRTCRNSHRRLFVRFCGLTVGCIRLSSQTRLAASLTRCHSVLFRTVDAPGCAHSDYEFFPLLRMGEWRGGECKGRVRYPSGSEREATPMYVLTQ